MATIGNLKIVVRADAAQAIRDLSAPLKALEGIESAADRAGRSMSSMKGPAAPAARPALASGGTEGGSGALSELGQAAAIVGSQIGAALSAGLAPLGTFASRLTQQFSQVGGTITTLARRIDLLVRAEFIERQLKRVDVGFKVAAGAGVIAAGAIASAWGVVFTPTIALLGVVMPAALAKVASLANRAASRVGGFFTMTGDVARRTLEQVDRFTFLNPIAGARRLALTFRGEVASSVRGASASVKSFGTQALAALGVFGLAFKAVQFFKDGIQGASDLNETLSKTDQVFGRASGAVTAQASEMAKAFGLNKGALLDGAAAIGIVATGSGIAQDEAAKLSNKMVRLAADAGSLQNVPLPEALAAIRSGLVGNSEPMLKLGVVMNEGLVKAEALRLGLHKGKGALDERAKVVASASLIERKLAVATGDLARTQDSAANQFRKAGGGLDNFATTIGTVLLPAVNSAVTGFNELLSATVDWFETNKAAVEGFAENVKAGFDGAGSVIRNSGDYWKIAELSATEAVGTITGWIGTIPENAKIVGEYIANNWVKLWLDAANAVGAIIQNIAQNLWDLGKAFVAFFKDPTQGFQFDFTPLLEGFKATADELPTLIRPAFVSMQEEMGEVFARIDANENKRKAGLAKFGDRAKALAVPEAAKAAEKDKKQEFAGAFQARSKESYSAIVAARGLGRDDSGKETARNTRQQVAQGNQANAHLATIARAASRMAAAAGPAIGDEFTF